MAILPTKCILIFQIPHQTYIEQPLTVKQKKEKKNRYRKIMMPFGTGRPCWQLYNVGQLTFTVKLIFVFCPQTKCFICGIGNDYFDTTPHGFETHTLQEHNLANYL